MPRKPPPEKYRLSVEMNLSLEAGARLEQVARKRDMSLGALVKELVFVGLNTLNYPPPHPHSLVKGVDPSGEGGYGIEG